MHGEEGNLEHALTIIRITVVGAKQSGKTSLINAFVNNYCPSVYNETNDPVLYYKTLHLGRAPGPGYQLSADEQSSLHETFPVLLEIEDTYASERKDGRDCYGRTREIRHFLNVFNTKTEQDHRDKLISGQTGDHKHSHDKALKGHVKETGKYQPTTLNRMGFLIVFDASDASSWEEAQESHKKLKEKMQQRTHHLEPVVFIVATKMDTVSDAGELKKKAYEYTRKNRLKFAEVSATKIHVVKMMFRDVIAEIQDRPGLWRVRAASHHPPIAPESQPSQAWGGLAFGVGDINEVTAAPARRTAALTEVVQGATESCKAPCNMQ